jgi:hypothetical protein
MTNISYSGYTMAVMELKLMTAMAGLKEQVSRCA